MDVIGPGFGLVKAIKGSAGIKITKELWGGFKRKTHFDDVMSRITSSIRIHTEAFAADPGLISEFFRLQTPNHVSFVLGNAHPNYSRWDVHPAHNEGMAPFRRFLSDKTFPSDISDWTLNTEYLEDQERIRRILARSLVVFGSPTSNYLPRMLFDYFLPDAKDGLSMRRRAVSGCNLRFEFILDSETILNRFPERHRYTVTRNGSIIPNWGIYDTHNRKNLIPEIIDNVVVKDYLLLTNVKNIFDGGKTAILSIAGTHGMGTAATALLFNDNNLLKRLVEGTRIYDEWQILIPVRKRPGLSDFEPGQIILDEIRIGECGISKSIVKAANSSKNVKAFVKLLAAGELN